jgi:hypothetical protein
MGYTGRDGLGPAGPQADLRYSIQEELAMPDRDNVVALVDRVLGECPACREPVVFAENFVRIGGAFAHVACTLPLETPPPQSPFDASPIPAPPADRGA